MRIDVKRTKVYLFRELSENAQQKALEKLWEINVDSEFWYECIIEDAKEVGKLMGIDINNIYFSGFWNQGDGACFEGNYEYRKNSAKLVQNYAPKDTELHRIAKELQRIQKRCFYQLYAIVKHRGHYSHKYCTEFTVQWNYDYYKKLPENVEDDLVETLRDFMDWIYDQLRKNYEYFTSKKSIIETIEANEYEFTEDGKLYF